MQESETIHSDSKNETLPPLPMLTGKQLIEYVFSCQQKLGEMEKDSGTQTSLQAEWILWKKADLTARLTRKMLFLLIDQINQIPSFPECLFCLQRNTRSGNGVYNRTESHSSCSCLSGGCCNPLGIAIRLYILYLDSNGVKSP